MSTLTHIMQQATFEHRLKLVLAWDFTVALRRPDVLPNHTGHYMVVECLEDYEHDEDGNSVGATWAVVGHDLSELLDEAFDYAMGMYSRSDEALIDIMAGGTGHLPTPQP